MLLLLPGAIRLSDPVLLGSGLLDEALSGAERIFAIALIPWEASCGVEIARASE